MAIEYTGRGDLAGTVKLLWSVRERGTPGPRPQFDAMAIADAAIAVADAGGLEGLSMRRVAARLGTSAMALYRYVASKADLIDVMVDRASSQTERRAVAGGWRERLENVARENRALFDAHPWLARVYPGRAPMGPGVLGKYEYELSCLDGIGLDDVEMDLALGLLLGYVRSSVLAASETARRVEQTTLDDQQWWTAMAPTLGQILDRYPLATRVGTAAVQRYGGVHDPELAFEFGLERVLDGIGTLIRSRLASA